MNRNTLMLGGVLAALIIIMVLLLQKHGEQDVPVEAAEHFLALDSASVDGIVIRTPSHAVTLNKEGTTWTITHPLVYKANASLVGELVHLMKELRVKSVASSNPEKFSLFEVDSAGMLVTLTQRGTDSVSFYVGKAGPSYSDTYVRKANSNDVVLVNQMLSSPVNRPVKDWRDKSIYSKQKESISEVSYQYGDTNFTMVKTDRGWVIGKDSVKENVATSAVSALSAMTADDFLDSATAATRSVRAVITIGTDQLRFAYDKSANKYDVQTSASPQWFVIEPWKADQILKRKKDLIR